jgi:hypothetical protein
MGSFIRDPSGPLPPLGHGNRRPADSDDDDDDYAARGGGRPKISPLKRAVIPRFDACVALTKTDDPHWLSEMECFARSAAPCGGGGGRRRQRLIASTGTFLSLVDAISKVKGTLWVL